MTESGSTYDLFWSNVKNAREEDYVIPIVKKSEDTANDFTNEAVRLLFINVSHEYEFVNRDFELWYPKVMKNGIILLHDVEHRE